MKKNLNKEFEIVDKIQNIIEEGDKASIEAEELTEECKKDSRLAKFLRSLIDEIELEEMMAEYKSNTLEDSDVERLKRDMSVIAKNNSRKKRRRVLALTATSLTVAAAALFFYFNVYDTVSNMPQSVVEEVKQEKVIAFDSKVDISKPVLYTNNDTINVLNQKRVLAVLGSQNADTQVGAANSQSEAKEESIPEVNKLVIPNGYIYKVILADGTEAILNANSELVYPSVFSDSVRRVSLRGEAYFKVTKSSRQFIVDSENGSVRVYGTEFNMNVRESGVLQTILVQGSVGVKGSDIGSEEYRLKPNQLARIDKSHDEIVIRNINPSDYVGWISGHFRFIKTDASALFKELSDWYSVDFKYSPNELRGVSITLSADKSSELDKILKMIENMTELKITKKGNAYEISK